MEVFLGCDTLSLAAGQSGAIYYIMMSGMSIMSSSCASQTWWCLKFGVKVSGGSLAAESSSSPHLLDQHHATINFLRLYRLAPAETEQL